MKISIKVFGYEIASLEFEGDDPVPTTKFPEQPIKKVSRWWAKRML